MKRATVELKIRWKLVGRKKRKRKPLKKVEKTKKRMTMKMEEKNVIVLHVPLSIKKVDATKRTMALVLGNNAELPKKRTTHLKNTTI